jgi:hypothetical protein
MITHLSFNSCEKNDSIDEQYDNSKHPIYYSAHEKVIDRAYSSVFPLQQNCFVIRLNKNSEVDQEQ